MQLSDPATVLIITLAATVIAFTVYAIYTAFGPPAQALADPFEEHED
jgi:PsbN protein